MFGGLNIVSRPPPVFESVGVQRTRHCSQCLQPEGAERTLLNCSQCKVTSYCGVACQKQHWQAQHKKDCKLVYNTRNSGDPYYHLPHARTLFAVCYRSCETFQHANWETCIDAYNYALSRDIRDYQIHDEISLAWLGLEKPAKALEELVKNVEFGPDPRPGIKIRHLTVLDDTQHVPTAWDCDWSETDLLLLLAIKLQVVAQLRAGREAYSPDLQAALLLEMEQNNNSKDVVLKEQERQARHIVSEIGQWWGGRIAYALRDARPFTEKDAPKLVLTEPEHWCLMQDVFLKSTGVKDVLYEFVR